MKTPKRDYFAYAEHDMYTTPGTANKLSTRWKRKNRIKQLKSTIQKYKDGTMLPKLIPLRQAYKWIQELKKPKADAPVICWIEYLSQVKSIRTMINLACEDAAVCMGVAIEKQERKEQEK